MRWFLPAVLVALVSSDARAEDWPNLLGPARNNTTSERVAPWTTAPTVLWDKTVGEGGGSPVIARGRVFFHGKVLNTEAEEILALDAVTGKQLWREEYPRRKFSSNVGNGPRATPAVSLGRVYTYGINGTLRCSEADTGKMRWQVDVHKLFDVGVIASGMGGSPVVEGNRVIVPVGGPGASLAAFDADKGELLWKALKDPVTTNLGPTIIPVGDGSSRQVVFQTTHRLAGIDLKSGEVVWEHLLSETPLASGPAPFWTGDMLFSSSVYFGSRGLRIEEKGGKWKASELWLNEKLGRYFPTVLPVGNGCLFVVTNTPNPGAELCCVEAKSGKVKWSRPNVAEWHAGLIGTGDGKVLFYDGKGVVRLIAPNTEKFEELAKAEIGPTALINPAFANGCLFARDKTRVVCVQFTKPGN